MASEDSFIVEGYEVEVNETEEPSVYHVILAEEGAQVFEIDVPINLEGSNLLIEDILNYAAKAAIDIFEAERDTLGEGAGALEIEANMKIKSQNITCNSCYFLTSCDYEEWFGQMKGTPYEDQAYQLLSQLIELQIPQSTSDELSKLYTEKNMIQYELDILNLERIKSSSDFQKIIIVEAVNQSKFVNRIGYANLDWIEYFLEKFKDHRLEPQVVLKVKELIDIHQAINIAESEQNDTWDQEQEIRNKMDLLSAEKAKNEIENRIPESGITVAPNMAEDIAELMEGVSFEEPLEPIIAGNKITIEYLEQMIEENNEEYGTNFSIGGAYGNYELWDGGNRIEIGSKKDIYEAFIKNRFKDDEPIIAINKEDEDDFEKEDTFTELGEIHQGIDIAEIPEEKRVPFGPGNQIKLKRNIEIPMWGGIKKEVKKDTKGWIDSLFDGHAEKFFVRLEDGSLFSVNRDDLVKG